VRFKAGVNVRQDLAADGLQPAGDGGAVGLERDGQAVNALILHIT